MPTLRVLMQVISAGWARGTCSVQVTPVGPSSPLSCQLTVWSPGSVSVRVRVWSALRWVRVTLPPLRMVNQASVSAAPSPAVVYALPWRIWVVSSVAVKEKFFVVSPISPTTFLVIVTDR